MFRIIAVQQSQLYKGSIQNRKEARALVTALVQTVKMEISKFIWSLWSQLLAHKTSV